MTGGVGPHQGSLAEYAAVDADLLAPKPDRLTMTEAAALPLAVITAWEGLVDRARCRRVTSCSSTAAGAGSAASPSSWRSPGARSVFATEVGPGLDAGPRPRCRADRRAGHAAQEYVEPATGGHGFDVMFDTRGGATLDASFAVVREHTGHVVSILGWGTHSLAPLSFRGATYSGVFTLLPLLTGGGRAHHGEILRAATDLVEAGLLLPRLATTGTTGARSWTPTGPWSKAPPGRSSSTCRAPRCRGRHPLPAARPRPPPTRRADGVRPVSHRSRPRRCGQGVR